MTVKDCKQFFDNGFNSEIRRDKNIILKTYTGEQIIPLGYINVKVTVNKTTKQLPLWIVQTGSNPIFGRNWLNEFKLQWHQLKTIRLASHSHSQQSHSTQKSLTDLLNKHCNIFSPGIGKIKEQKAKLTLIPDASPKFCKARTVPYALMQKVEKELDNLEKEGVISKVDYSDWATPIVPVLKKSGDIRLCGDFKVTINPQLQAEQYTLPKIEDIFANLGCGKRFSKIDLRQAYLQLPLDDKSRLLTTINTHKGLYVYNRLVFGITSSPAIWQKTIDRILQGAKGVQCNQDDMIITGENDEEHLQNLAEVLKRLEDHGLKANKDKCLFFQDQVIYCGFKISKDGLHKMPDKVEAVVNAPTPENKTQLRAFLGLLNYYHKFLRNVAHEIQPLHQLLQKDKPFIWSAHCQQAFLKAKQMITSEEVLMRYNPNLPLRLACDASPYGIGGVLSHLTENNEERPIGYISRTLTPAEKNYSQIDKEALAIVWSVKKFYNYICGRHFTLYTDHQPLKYIFSPSTGIPVMSAARQQRYAAFLSGFNYTIEYKSSKNHANADSFSRLPLPSTEKDDSLMETMYYTEILDALPIDSTTVSKSSRQDAAISKVMDYLASTWPSTVNDDIKPFLHRQHELSIHQNCLLWGSRVIIPTKLRSQVLHQLHDGHLGIVKMKTMARNYFWWPGLDKDIEQLAKSCTGCMFSQQNPQPSPLHPWVFPDKPWQRLHIDYAGPFLGRMFLIVIDAHSKWAEVIPTNSSTSSATIDILHTIFARFGLPTQLVSDNAPTFTSEEFRNFMRSNGIKHITGAPYHPSTNGIAERFVQVFKNAMKSAKPDHGSLYNKLSKFLLAYRNVSHNTTGETPAKLLLGKNTRTRLDLLKPSLSNKVSQSQSDQVKNHSQAQTRVFDIGDKVLARDYRTNKWAYGTITSQTGPLSYCIETSPNVQWRRHADQLIHTNTPKPPDIDPSVLFIPQHSANKPYTNDSAAEKGISPEKSNNILPGLASLPTTASVPCSAPTAPQQSLRKSNRARKAPVKLNL